MKIILLLIPLFLLMFLAAASAQAGSRWSKKKAWDWVRQKGWRVGCNYIPHTAVNQLEMWQGETFDPATIDKELGWAEGLGMTAIRVYLHDLLGQDLEGLTRRMNQFLEIAHKHRIAVLFVIFDDCWNGEFKAGPQPAPKPATHNSRWLQSPGVSRVEDAQEYPRLKT